MNFWKTSFWSLIATGSKLLSQFVVAKLIAVFAGAATFGIFGQFLSFINVVQLGSGGVVNGGVIKYVSDYHKDPTQLKKLIATSVKFAFFSSLITGLLIAIFCMPLSYYIFQGYDYWWVLVVFGLTLFGYTLNQVFLSIFNGLNQMMYYASIAIFGAMFSISLIGILTYFYHTKGALLGFVLSQLCMFFVGFLYLKKLPVQLKLIKTKIDKKELKKLVVFSLMPIASAIAIPLTEMFLRYYVAYHSSWISVGYWQAILRISDAYLLIITTIISTYALPKYSRINDKRELKKEVLSILLKLVPCAAVLAFLIYILRDYIILLLFTDKFLVMRHLFVFQLMGDVFKVGACVVANVLVAKAQVRNFIKLQIIFTISYAFLSVLFFDFYGLTGLTIAFFVNYVIYFFVVLIYFSHYLREFDS